MGSQEKFEENPLREVSLEKLVREVQAEAKKGEIVEISAKFETISSRGDGPEYFNRNIQALGLVFKDRGQYESNNGEILEETDEDVFEVLYVRMGREYGYKKISLGKFLLWKGGLTKPLFKRKANLPKEIKENTGKLIESICDYRNRIGGNLLTQPSMTKHYLREAGYCSIRIRDKVIPLEEATNSQLRIFLEDFGRENNLRIGPSFFW